MSAHHTLRPYQLKAIEEIRKHFSNGVKKVLLQLSTGGGKTTIFSDILKKLSEKGNKGAIVVRGRKLVDQAHKRLMREDVVHGVRMNSHWCVNTKAPIQVCSIDTMLSRGLTPEGSLLVIDEAHLFLSKACVEFCDDFLQKNPGAFILAVTATPYSKKSMRHFADVVVKPVAITELIDDGYLVPPVYYAPTNPDLTGVRISNTTEDYVTADLEKILNGNDIVGNLVQNWVNFAENRSTICFCVSIVHSKHVAEMYNAAGIPARHCDADSTDEEREQAVKDLEEGRLKVITNVGIFCTGVDIPILGCVQLARPTESYNLYIQMAGRGTRPFKGKDNFILLDNGGNVLRHGFITEEPECNLDGAPPKKGSSILIKTCKKCFAVFNQFSSHCPQCGTTSKDPDSERMVSELDGTLVKIDTMPIEAIAYRRHRELKKIRKEKGYKRGWIYHAMVKEFGEEIAVKYCPKREKPKWL